MLASSIPSLLASTKCTLSPDLSGIDLFFSLSSANRLSTLISKCRVREITRRKRGRSLNHVVWNLNQFLCGCSIYFNQGMSRTLAKELDHWIRRRLRSYVWKQWKTPKTRVRNIKVRGICHKLAKIVGIASKGEWRLSKNSNVVHALSDTYFNRSLGLVLICQICQ